MSHSTRNLSRHHQGPEGAPSDLAFNPEDFLEPVHEVQNDERPNTAPTVPTSPVSAPLYHQPAHAPEAKRHIMPRKIRTLAKLGGVGLALFGAVEVAHNLFGFNLGGKVIPHHSAQAWTLERSMNRLYDPNQAILRAGDGTDIYKTHTSFGKNVFLVGGLADDAFGKDYVAGMKGELQLLMSNDIKDHKTTKPAYTWSTYPTTKTVTAPNGTVTTKPAESVKFKVNDAALGWQMAKVDCLVEPGSSGKCYGNISRTTFDQVAPWIEGGVTVVPGLGLVARAITVVSVSLFSNLVEQNGSDGSRELATYQAAVKNYANGCAYKLDKTAAVTTSLDKYFKVFLSANSVLAANDGLGNKATLLAQAAPNVKVELDGPNGKPITSKYVPIAPPAAETRSELAHRMGVSTKRLTMPPVSKGCDVKLSAKNTNTYNVNAVKRTYEQGKNQKLTNLLKTVAQ